MELRLPLEMSPGREAACRAVFGTWGFFRTMHGKTALRVDFIQRVEFGKVAGHGVLIKSGPGNRGPTECGTTHGATSGMSSRSEEHTSELQSPKDLVCRLLLEKKKKKQTSHMDS